jgi:hypothetical protein
MNKFLTGLTATALTAGALLMIGCESKDKGYTNLEPGDPESQEFQDFQDVADGLSDVSGDMVDGMFEQCGMILGLNDSPASKERNALSGHFASAETDSFVATYNDVSHYWHTYWSYTDSSRGVTAVYQDSIQFREGDSAVQWPNTEVITEVRCGQLATIMFENEDGSFTITAASHWSVTGEPGAIPGGGEIKINGGVNHQVEANGLTSGCNTDLNMDAAFDDVTTTLPSLQASETCPTMGSVIMTGTVSSVCESEEGTGSFDGSWYWKATFTEGTISISANNGEFEWELELPCGGEPVL